MSRPPLTLSELEAQFLIDTLQAIQAEIAELEAEVTPALEEQIDEALEILGVQPDAEDQEDEA